MEHFFADLNRALSEGKSFILAGIIASKGSAPRSSGAKMAVFENGDIAGTIGGGAIEHASIQAALERFGKQGSWSRVFSLSGNGENPLNMACGGQVEVSFIFIDPGDARIIDLFGQIREGFKQNLDLWLVTKCVCGETKNLGLYDPVHGLRFFMGREILSKSLKARLFKGTPVRIGENTDIPETVNDTSMPEATVWLSEPLNDSGYTYIFGGGHVAQALVPVIGAVDFKPVIYEDREDFCRMELFPGAHHVIFGGFDQAAEKITLTKKDYVVIMTRGHRCDYQVLTQVLKSPAAYIGVMGSRNKIEQTKQKLLADGFSPEEIDRIHWPIGLPIKAQTPAEIAVSVAAQMICIRAELREGTQYQGHIPCPAHMEERDGLKCPER